MRNAGRFCAKHPVITRMATAPRMVPSIRYQPLRNEAPRVGWHTAAADAPAQKGLSSCNQNATNNARLTEAAIRRPYASGGYRALPAAHEGIKARVIGIMSDLNGTLISHHVALCHLPGIEKDAQHWTHPPRAGPSDRIRQWGGFKTRIGVACRRCFEHVAISAKWTGRSVL